jgi:hypothetical protein
MPSINISDLRPAGSELFSDSESYMAELGDSEFEMINGGATPATPSISVSVSIRWTINMSAKRTPQATDYLTPTPPAISQFISALSNPFNSF